MAHFSLSVEIAKNRLGSMHEAKEKKIETKVNKINKTI